MLEEFYEWDESLTEDDYYDAIEFMIGDLYPNASEEELEDLLENMLEEMPPHYAEAVKDTLFKFGKGFGTGALKFAAKNPKLIKGAATIGGSFFGGPLVGGKIGAKVGDLVNKAAGKKYLPQTGKALQMMQSPQVLKGMAQATLGLGNGMATVNINGKDQAIALGIIIRTLVNAGYNALKELEQLEMVPSKRLTEDLPYADDMDAQVEWLTEQLIA